MQNKLVVSSRCHFAESVVFLDGLTGTGKTMMGPLISSLNRVELGRFEYLYECLCELDALKKIDRDAGEYMMNMWADLSLYNSMIARETNFRWNDLSGVFRNPRPWPYVRRLFMKDGAVVLDRIRNERPILHLISHQALGAMDLAFRVFGDRLRVVEMVRHPFYLLEHWYTYIDRYGTDPRDFTLWIDHKGKALPWFAAGMEERYAASNAMDRVIFSVEALVTQAETFKASLPQARRLQIVTVPFERFVLGPLEYMQKISESLKTEMTALTHKELKRQKCPRTQVAAGPDKAIYRRYGWKKPDLRVDEKAVLVKKREFALQKGASRSALDALDRMAQNYEKQYGLWFQDIYE